MHAPTRPRRARLALGALAVVLAVVTVVGNRVGPVHTVGPAGASAAADAWGERPAAGSPLMVVPSATSTTAHAVERRVPAPLVAVLLAALLVLVSAQAGYDVARPHRVPTRWALRRIAAGRAPPSLS